MREVSYLEDDWIVDHIALMNIKHKVQDSATLREILSLPFLRKMESMIVATLEGCVSQPTPTLKR